MRQLLGFLTVMAVFSMGLTACNREGKERTRPRLSRDLKREILEIQNEQAALKKEYDIQVDSGGYRVQTAHIYGWHSKSLDEKATIKLRLKRFVKTCNKILEDATDPSLKGKVAVQDFVRARENAKAYLKSLRDSEEEQKPDAKEKDKKEEGAKGRRERERDEDD